MAYVIVVGTDYSDASRIYGPYETAVEATEATRKLAAAEVELSDALVATEHEDGVTVHDKQVPADEADNTVEFSYQELIQP